MNNAELIKALRYCAEHEGCDYYIAKDCPRESTMKHYKAAYRTTYKLYQEARNEQQP